MNEEIDNNLDPIAEETQNDTQQTSDIKHYVKVGIVAVLLVAVGFLFGYVIGVSNAPGNVYIPETEVATENTGCTSAPESTTSIPEPTESIPTETTEAPTEPSVTQDTIANPSHETPSIPVSDEKDEQVGMSELEMLACVIYQEAGGNGSCDNCRRYVADIVLNRVNDPRFPNDIYGVLTAEGQYGRFHWTDVKWAERANYDTEKDAVDRAYRVAEEVLNGQHSELYGNGYVWQAGFKQGTDGFWCCGHWYGR